MRLLARLYYKDEEQAEFEPDVEWQETDDGTILIGEVCGGLEFGEGTTERVPKKGLIENLKHYAFGPNRKLFIYDTDLAKRLEKEHIPHKYAKDEYSEEW